MIRIRKSRSVTLATYLPLRNLRKADGAWRNTWLAVRPNSREAFGSDRPDLILAGTWTMRSQSSWDSRDIAKYCLAVRGAAWPTFCERRRTDLFLAAPSLLCLWALRFTCLAWATMCFSYFLSSFADGFRKRSRTGRFAFPVCGTSSLNQPVALVRDTKMFFASRL